MMAVNAFFFSSRRRHTRYWRDWSSDVCSSDLKRSHSDFARQSRLLNETTSSAAHCLGSGLRIGMAGDEYYRRAAIGGRFMNLGTGNKPIHSWHAQDRKSIV